MEETLKSIIGGLVFQIAKLQSELQAANAKLAALTKEKEG